MPDEDFSDDSSAVDFHVNQGTVNSDVKTNKKDDKDFQDHNFGVGIWNNRSNEGANLSKIFNVFKSDYYIFNYFLL